MVSNNMREKERKEAMKNFAKKLALAGVVLAMAGGVATQRAGVAAADSTLGTTSIQMQSATPANVNVSTDAGSLLKTVITLIIVVAALLTLFYLVMGAIAWITSGGDKGKVEEARNKITAAVIGLLILAAVWAIFNLVLTIAFGGATNLNVPGFTTSSSDGSVPWHYN